MPETSQNFENHARFDPLYHYFMVPILMINLFWCGWNLRRNFRGPTVQAMLLAIALVVLGLMARINALRAQDRLIRLEEQLRFERLGIGAKFAGLTVPQLVALRFASDAELASLADQVKAGKLTASKEIKAAIKNWRPDYVRV
jgi:Family of unknown function (DUF6526)